MWDIFEEKKLLSSKKNEERERERVGSVSKMFKSMVQSNWVGVWRLKRVNVRRWICLSKCSLSSLCCFSLHREKRSSVFLYKLLFFLYLNREWNIIYICIEISNCFVEILKQNYLPSVTLITCISAWIFEMAKTLLTLQLFKITCFPCENACYACYTDVRWSYYEFYTYR